MKLTVTLRSDKNAKTLRKEGLIPGIIYGKHVKTPITIASAKNEMIKIYKEAGYSTPITLSGDDVDQFVLIQDIQLDPVTDELLHVDFLAVNKNEKVTTEVPVKTIGESPLEKSGDGQIQLVKDFVEVEAFPQDLPSNITIDISVIQNINDTVCVKDLKFSDKVEVLDDPEQVIITVVTATEEVEEAPAAAEGAAPAEGAAAEGAAPAKEEKKEEKK